MNFLSFFFSLKLTKMGEKFFRYRFYGRKMGEKTGNKKQKLEKIRNQKIRIYTGFHSSMGLKK
jgi:hypothetical protein